MGRSAKTATPSATGETRIHEQLLTTLQVIGDCLTVSRESLPKNVYESVMARVAECQGLISGLRGDDSATETAVCDPLHELQQVIAAHDAAFVQRELLHQLRAAPRLPKAAMAPERFRLVAAELLECAMRLASRASHVEAIVAEIPMRQGTGVECSIVAYAPHFSERDRYRLFEEFAPRAPNDRGTHGAHDDEMGLAICRRVLEEAHGQLWVESPAKGKVALAFAVPAVRDADTPRAHRRLKCDIVVTNYPALQEAHGMAKAATVLNRIESILRERVRHPLDAVAAFEPRGVVSALLDLPYQAAEVVLGRFREALHREEFTIGRQAVEVALEYRMIPLP